MSYDRQLSLCLFFAFVLFLRAHISEGMRQETTIPIFISLFYSHYAEIRLIWSLGKDRKECVNDKYEGCIIQTQKSFKGICFPDLFTAYALEAGKDKVVTVAPGLFACKKISFQHSFYGAQQVNVFASIGHTVKSSLPRNSATLWVESVTTSGFKVCVLEYGKGSNETAEVNWIAFQTAPSGSQFGSITFNYLITGTQCKKIGLIQVRNTFLYPTPVPLSTCPSLFIPIVPLPH